MSDIQTVQTKGSVTRWGATNINKEGEGKGIEDRGGEVKTAKKPSR